MRHAIRWVSYQICGRIVFHNYGIIIRWRSYKSRETLQKLFEMIVKMNNTCCFNCKVGWENIYNYATNDYFLGLSCVSFFDTFPYNKRKPGCKCHHSKYHLAG